MGLKAIPNSPCIFRGTIIPGKPPLTLGLCVDDCIYFSENKDVELEFEKRLTEAINGKISFMGNVTQFLGIKFAHHID